jgi:hypothetical protein
MLVLLGASPPIKQAAWGPGVGTPRRWQLGRWRRPRKALESVAHWALAAEEDLGGHQVIVLLSPLSSGVLLRFMMSIGLRKRERNRCCRLGFAGLSSCICTARNELWAKWQRIMGLVTIISRLLIVLLSFLWHTLAQIYRHKKYYSLLKQHECNVSV